ncbi:hypothetical protein HK096_010285, partial [Nowakowskiella sp. JEL0078]
MPDPLDSALDLHYKDKAAATTSVAVGESVLDSDEDVLQPISDPRESNAGLLEDVPDDAEDLDLSHCRIQTLEGLQLERFTDLS